MILELAANRVLTPWFGNTLFTWTGLLGVILIALSGGYYAGGWLADSKGDYKTLSHLLALAAATIFLIPLAHRLVGKYVHHTDTMLGPILASSALFALPGVLLGSLTPYIIRLVSLLSRDRQIGLSAGSIIMVSTLGSVIGTFSAGFILIPHLNLDTLFIIIGGLLLGSALLGYLCLETTAISSITVFFGIMNMLLVVSALLAEPAKEAEVIYDKSNFYHRIRVFQKQASNGDQMISLYLDTTFQGAQYVRSMEIPSRYQRYWALSQIFCPRLERAAFLGGGAFAMPEAMIRHHPSVKVDVVEIDPQLTEVGRRFFRTGDYPQLTVISDDARHYLRLANAKYDVIFGDVYHGVRTVPAHLLTVEFFSLVKDRLTERGVFLMNLIGSIEGENALLFKSTLRTINAVFKQTYIFAMEPENLQKLQNIIIAASNNDTGLDLARIQQADANPLTKPLLAHYLSNEKYTLAGAYLISDALNPVEYLITKSLYFTDH